MRNFFVVFGFIGFAFSVVYGRFPTALSSGFGATANRSFRMNLSIGHISGRAASQGLSAHLGFLPASRGAFVHYLTIGHPLAVRPVDGTLAVKQYVVKPERDMTLEWTDGTNQVPVRYRVFFGTNPASLPLTATTSNRSHTVEGLEFATPYAWRIEAFDEFGRATLSDAFSFSISPVVGNFYAAPNPFRAGAEPTTFLFSMPGPGTAHLEIFAFPYYDVVFERDLDGLQDGSNVFVYDGRDMSGAALYNGVYLVRISMNGERGHVEKKHKLLVVR